MMRHMVTAALTAALAFAACDDTPLSDPRTDVALAVGSYSAEGAFGAFTLTTRTEGDDEVVDWLERGASILLVLREDGTTGGRLFVPGGDEDGTDLDMDLEGTWNLIGTNVELEHEADTFLRDMTFQLDDGVLSGSETFDDTTISVSLVRR